MKRFLIFAITCLVPLSALASKPDKARLVDTYMELANVKAGHATLAKTVLEGISQTQKQLGVDVNKLPRETQMELRRIQGVVKTIFAADVFNKGVANYLNEKVDAGQLEKANKVLKDSMVRRVSKLERQMMGKVDYNKLKAYHITLSVNPPSKARMQYVNYIDQVTESSKYGSYLGQYIFTLFSGAALDVKTIAEIDKATKDQVVLTLLYYYRTLSDDDLRGYVEMMMMDDDVAWVIRQTAKAEVAVAARAFEKLSQELVVSSGRVSKATM